MVILIYVLIKHIIHPGMLGIPGDTQIFSAGLQEAPEGFVDPEFPPNKESMGPKVSCYCEPNGYKVPEFVKYSKTFRLPTFRSFLFIYFDGLIIFQKGHGFAHSLCSVRLIGPVSRNTLRRPCFLMTPSLAIFFREC